MGKKTSMIVLNEPGFDHLREMLYATPLIAHCYIHVQPAGLKDVPGLYLGLGISALRVPHKPGFIMHIMTFLNVARGRTNHFLNPFAPTSSHHLPGSTPTPLPQLKTFSSHYNTRQFPSGGPISSRMRKGGVSLRAVLCQWEGGGEGGVQLLTGHILLLLVARRQMVSSARP